MKPRELLRNLMNLEGLNPTSLARRTGDRTKQPQIHRFLTGEAREPKRSTLQPVADYFHIPVDALFDEQVATATWAKVAQLPSVARSIGNVFAAPPPAPPPDFADRREVSDSDWAALTAVKTLYTHDEIEDMKTRAMEKLQETTAMLRRQQAKAASTARPATAPPSSWIGPERRVHSTPVPTERRREFRNSDDIDSFSTGAEESGK